MLHVPWYFDFDSAVTCLSFSERSPRERRGRAGSPGTDEKGAGGGEGGEKDSHTHTFPLIQRRLNRNMFFASAQ